MRNIQLSKSPKYQTIVLFDFCQCIAEVMNFMGKRRFAVALLGLFVLVFILLAHFNRVWMGYTNPTTHTFYSADLIRNYPVNIEDQDVIVFLHMQKTGGTTFGKHLVKDLAVDIPCDCSLGKKRCRCENSKKQVWLFSRYSTGWICGLHADWTELKDCVNDALDKTEQAHRKRRYPLSFHHTLSQYTACSCCKMVSD